MKEALIGFDFNAQILKHFKDFGASNDVVFNLFKIILPSRYHQTHRQ